MYGFENLITVFPEAKSVTKASQGAYFVYIDCEHAGLACLVFYIAFYIQTFFLKPLLGLCKLEKVNFFTQAVCVNDEWSIV